MQVTLGVTTETQTLQNEQSVSHWSGPISARPTNSSSAQSNIWIQNRWWCKSVEFGPSDFRNGAQKFKILILKDYLGQQTTNLGVGRSNRSGRAIYQ
jgi:hypothetical protein